jgi:hypothetical protein
MVPTVVAGLVLSAWCGWASGFAQSSVGAFTTWSISLAVVIAVNLLLGRGRRGLHPALHLAPVGEPWPRPGRRGRGRTLLGVLPWLSFGCILLAWELLGIDTPANETHVTISALAQEYRPLNAALLLVWILVGLGYGAARARAPIGIHAVEPSRDLAPRAVLGAVLLAGLGHPTPMLTLLLPQSKALGVGFWVLVVVAFVLLDVAAKRSRGRVPNAEELARLISGRATARVFIGVAWIFGGWHLFAH